MKPNANIKGLLGYIKKSTNAFSAIDEAVMNSLESIEQRKGLNVSFAPSISINLYYLTLLDASLRELKECHIIDNGIGFEAKNYARFLDFFDNSKGYKNRGTGRLQFLHRFKEVEIESDYFVGKKVEHVSAKFSDQSFQNFKETREVDESKNIETSLVFKIPKFSTSEKKLFDTLDIDELKSHLLNFLMLRLYLDKCKDEKNLVKIKINFFLDGKLHSEREISTLDIPEPDKSDSFEVSYKKINYSAENKIAWHKSRDKKARITYAHFKIDEEKQSQNALFICSKGVPIEQINFPILKKSEVVDGSRFLTLFYGDDLDEPTNISHSVDNILLPTKEDIERAIGDMYFNEEIEYLLKDDVKEAIDLKIKEIYNKVFEAERKQNENVSKIAKAHAIPDYIAKNAKLNITDNEETITKKLYVAQSEYIAPKGYQAKQLFDSLKSLTPTDPNYQNELSQKAAELSDLIDEQNKEELGRYIIRREMVADLLLKILHQELDYQLVPSEKGERKSKEYLIHDLIIKRKTNTNFINDLWIFDEELIHFDAVSDESIGKIRDSEGNRLLKEIPDEEIAKLGLKLDRRPDIFVFPVNGSCLIIELKDPKVDLSNHLNQIIRYCTLIANYSVNEISQFSCYLIGESINEYDLEATYNMTLSGGWFRDGIPLRALNGEPSKASARIEIIKLSTIGKRAHDRNKSFADKLGIPDLLK